MFSSERKSRAGSSVWYERRIRNAEVVGPNPARSTDRFFRKNFPQKKATLFPCVGLERPIWSVLSPMRIQMNNLLLFPQVDSTSVRLKLMETALLAISRVRSITFWCEEEKTMFTLVFAHIRLLILSKMSCA